MDKRIPMTETFLEVEEMIWQCCNEFQEWYGKEKPFDMDDLFSFASIKFVEAYESFDPSNGLKFTSYLGICIYRGLLSEYVTKRSRAKNKGVVVSIDKPVGDGEANLAPTIADTFTDQSSIWHGLSEDASMIIDLVLQAPKDISDAVGISSSGAKWKKAIKTHLKSLGWENWRIRQSFNEIQEALQT